jgi:hypothetical protein
MTGLSPIAAGAAVWTPRQVARYYATYCVLPAFIWLWLTFQTPLPRRCSSLHGYRAIGCTLSPAIVLWLTFLPAFWTSIHPVGDTEETAHDPANECRQQHENKEAARQIADCLACCEKPLFR